MMVVTVCNLGVDFRPNTDIPLTSIPQTESP